jgi:hypothetical protein
MKKIIFAIAIMATSFASAQVGVGNTDPKATLDVTGVTTATVADGVLVPRFTAATLATKDAAYGADQNGALVFITDIANATGKTSNVTTVGFHYYDNATSKWKAVGGASATPAYQNIGGGVQTGDGTFTIADTTYFVVHSGATAGTLTMPTPVAGKTLWVKNIGTNAATVAGQSINGGRMRAFVCDGTNWYPSNQ